jgi:predicted AlkP superfamily phosphohydrolase/phosphomutase
MRKAIIIGLDCAAPKLLFERFKDKLPNFRKLMAHGVYGKLRSSDPPITIPAWTVMASSRSPGHLGMYGFRHRKDNDYKKIWIATSLNIKVKRIWDYVSQHGGKSCVIAVPPSFPPVPIDGWLVGGFITPDTTGDYTYPRELKDEISKVVPDYEVDVEFRIEDKDNLVKDLFDLTRKHFKLVKHMLRTKDWKFAMFVEIGLDRIHHAFWKYYDETHHLYESGNRFENVMEDYYVLLDDEIGEIMDIVGVDTSVMVASDHGGKPMKGAFCVNSWLIKEGLLKLKTPISEVTRFDDADVDWENTVAWGWGGYYARIFLNVKGREKCGTINSEDYEKIRDEIADKIKKIRGPNGENWNTVVLKPEQVYNETNGDPPDLMVYFDDLYWRSAGTIGHPCIYLSENDTGPDDAVHDKYGLYIFNNPRENYGGRNVTADILDIAPTILKGMQIPLPKELEGKPII